MSNQDQPEQETQADTLRYYISVDSESVEVLNVTSDGVFTWNKDAALLIPQTRNPAQRKVFEVLYRATSN